MGCLEWLDQFKAAKSVAELDHLLHQYLSAQGVSGYTFSYFGKTHTLKKNRLQHEVVSERMHAWHDYYHEENYEAKDSTHQMVHKNLLPVAWNVAEQLASARTEKERVLRQETLDFGVTEGLSIPLYGANGDFADLTLRQFKGETCLHDWLYRQSEWYFVALGYFNYLCALALHECAPILNVLTPRESQCLSCLLDSYSITEIAETLKMTERTVNFHIQNLNRKLKVRNKYEAVVKAKALGLSVSKN